MYFFDVPFKGTVDGRYLLPLPCPYKEFAPPRFQAAKVRAPRCEGLALLALAGLGRLPGVTFFFGCGGGYVFVTFLILVHGIFFFISPSKNFK